MERLYDVVIVGGGPAGLTAALYLARAQYRVLVLEKDHFGGQITITAEVVNYPGIERIDGRSLTDAMRRQAQSFGAEFLLAEAERLIVDGDVKTVSTNRGDFRCFGVLLATGASPRMVGFKGEEEFRGHGVAYCATCDGEFFAGKDVYVIGGGFAAAEESVFLTRYARHVTILMRGDDFTCAASVAEPARNHEKIEILTNTVVEEVYGDSALRGIRWRNTKTGETTERRAADGDTFGVFVFAGYRPATELVRGIVELNDQGCIVVDRAQRTSAEGVYAAGDVCAKSLRQVATAVGDGALAATELEKHAAWMQKKTGLLPKRPEPPKPSARTASATDGAQADAGALFDADMLAQLTAAFSRMESPLILRLTLNDSPASAELRRYMEALCGLTDKLSMKIASPDEAAADPPCVEILRADGSPSGLAFHGVPGGHEFTSFVLGLYNVAGPGQALDPEIRETVRSIRRPVRMKILVSLSCTMCPELVVAAQKIAAENDLVSAEVYDLNHYPALREKHAVMSVPCLVVDDGRTTFGKKNIRQLLDFLLTR